MSKNEFLERLREGLSGLPQGDIEERLSFYGEMIDDRMEDGLAEEAAVAEIGSVDEVVAQIIEETPIGRIVIEKVRPKRRMRAWEIVLLVLGFPLWFPLLIAAFAVVLSVYVVIWAVIVSVWAVDLSLAVSAIGCAAVGIVLLCRGEGLRGLCAIGAGLVLAGLALFLFFGCKAATCGALKLTKRIARWIKSLFLGKEKTK